MLNRVVLCLAAIGLAHAALQNITVVGRAFCYDKPAPDVAIRLMEINWVFPLDELNDTGTDAQGRFEIFGEDAEFTRIQPILLFYHQCAATVDCYRSTEIVLPVQEIGHVYHLPHIPLELYSDESCN